MFSSIKKLFSGSVNSEFSADVVELDFNNLQAVAELYLVLSKEKETLEKKIKENDDPQFYEPYFVNLATLEKLEERLRLCDKKTEAITSFTNRPRRYLGLGDFLRMEASRSVIEQARKDLAERILEGKQASRKGLGDFISSKFTP